MLKLKSFKTKTYVIFTMAGQISLMHTEAVDGNVPLAPSHDVYISQLVSNVIPYPIFY